MNNDLLVKKTVRYFYVGTLRSTLDVLKRTTLKETIINSSLDVTGISNLSNTEIKSNGCYRKTSLHSRS